MKLLVIQADFYSDIAEYLLHGAQTVLKDSSLLDVIDVLSIPGALEIPAMIKMYKDHYDGFLALGCVIRGETTHYDVVVEQSARGIMDLCIHYDLVIGNGILTCENKQQALVRSNPEQKNKGGEAARTVLSLLAHKKKAHSYE